MALPVSTNCLTPLLAWIDYRDARYIRLGIALLRPGDSVAMSRPLHCSIGRARRSRVGFTLLELLVTICVIGVLTGLLLPAVQHARQASHTVSCQSNLRQWALAVQYYAQAHHDYLPRRGQGIQPTGIFNRDDDWFNALPPYMNLPPYINLLQQNLQPMPGAGGVWMCPAAVDLPDPAPSTFLAYGMNMWLSTWYTTNPDRLEMSAV